MNIQINISSKLEINKLSRLHNESTIFFCKTDYILEDFKIISQLNNDVVFITGNSDYAITDKLVSLAPSNIKKWYCQNAVSNYDIIEPLPIGLENKEESLRNGHGIAYPERADFKEALINRAQKIKSKIYDKIYANFNIYTNPYHRGLIKELCVGADHIAWDEWCDDLDKYYTKLVDYDMILCPAGNGIDTHRLWEMLYCNKIPIVIKLGNYKIYELYQQLPIILLDNIKDIKNYSIINNKYIESQKNKNNLYLLNINYWIYKILN